MKRIFCLLFFLYVAQVGFAGKATNNLGDIRSLDVYVTSKGEHLLLGEEDASGNNGRLFYLFSGDDGHTWSTPVQVSMHMPAPHNLARGADAQIAAAGDKLVAVWQTAGGDTYGGGPMATALSGDGGKTWQPGPRPADDKLNIGHGYIDIASDSKGAFHLVWLDSRDGKQGLYYARSADGGEHWSKNITVDPLTCECCWTTVKAYNGKLFVLYRDLNPRDMALARSSDDGKSWRKISTVGAFDWHFNGCPEVGGDVAITPNELHAITWTGKQDHAGVYEWNSTDDGVTWDSRKLGDDDARNPDLASRGKELAAVWDDSSKGILVATSADSGKTWRSYRVKEASQHATHPRIVPTTKSFRVFWTQPQGSESVWRSIELDHRDD